MKLIPNYSYEFNCILNETFSEEDQIKNFASLLTDKDRFLSLLPKLELNSSLIERILGYKLKEEIEFYIVRAEKFNSFSTPVTIEYSLIPEEMILYLLKEIIKVSIKDRFPSEFDQESHINSFIEYIINLNDWEGPDLKPFIEILHNNSSKKYKNYKITKIDFEKLPMNSIIEELFLKEIYGSENMDDEEKKNNQLK